MSAWVNKRLVPLEKRAVAGTGWAAAVAAGGKPLIKRIILRCTVQPRSCPVGLD